MTLITQSQDALLNRADSYGAEMCSAAHINQYRCNVCIPLKSIVRPELETRGQSPKICSDSKRLKQKVESWIVSLYPAGLPDLY